MPASDLVELDFSNKLEITINNTVPVELTGLTMALLGVSQQYQRFIENEATAQCRAGSELFIKEVRSGSIIVELVAQTLPVVPLFWQGGSLLEWANHAKSVMEWLNGKRAQPPKSVTKQDLRQWHNILEPVAKDRGAQMNFSVSEGSQVTNQFFITSEGANAAQNAIHREVGRLEEPADHVERQRVMVWYQTKFDDKSKTGNRAVVESISKAAVKVIFENNAVKKAMLAGDPRFDKPWHELAYIVDVRVQTLQGVPKVYTITNYYDEDTFDPVE